MNIISHRGFWRDKEEMNTRTSFLRAIENNFGIETDVRDHSGELVISHDMPIGDKNITFDEFLYNYKKNCNKNHCNVTIIVPQQIKTTI
jgi:glycerophosphoryl diester phosphodiesterase